MSVNISVDGTTYNGITAISVADKILTLSSSSSGGCASGTFTPTEETFTQTIQTGLSNVSGFLVVIDADYTTQSVRWVNCIFQDVENDYLLSIGSNVNGNTPFSSGVINSTSTFATTTTVSGGDITITCYDSGSSGYFITSQYRWYAW